MTDDDLEADLRERHRISTIGGASTIYSRAADRLDHLEAQLATERRKRRNYDDRIVELETELDHINRPAP